MPDNPRSKPAITAARVSRWIDTKTFTDQFGVEVRANKKWHHLAIGGKAALYATAAEADAQAQEIRRQIGIVKERAA